MRRLRTCSLGLVVLLLAGCSGAAMDPSSPRSEATGQVAAKDRGPAQPPARDAPAGGAKQPPAREKLPRKIVYTATLTIVVEDFGPARERLDKLVAAEDGAFVAFADTTGAVGSPRRGEWTIRVPVAQLDAFVRAVSTLGEVTRSTLDARDVTEEYYDVEADIRNKKVEEEAFLGLEKTATKFDDLLAAKREVHRVRTEIDRLQKRLAVLADLTTLTTVRLTIYERRDYVPESPTYTTTLGRTWEASWAALLTFGKNLLVALVAATPWLLVLGVVGGPVLWLLLRLRSATKEEPVEEVKEAE